MQYPAHGANAASLYKALEMEMPADVIDLSENVNVFQTPDAVQQQWASSFSLLQAYPHEQAEPFTSAAAEHHGVSRAYVKATNGAAEALHVLAQYLQKQTVVLFEPSFSEYRRTLTHAGCTIVPVVAQSITNYTFCDEEVHDALRQADACYICNPNNPTGALTSRATIEAYVQQYPQCLFVIDEAFIDWTDEAQSCVSLVEAYDNIVVLRSMTKMYGLAGVRLGYMLTQHVPHLHGYFPHWHVSGLAIALGTTCLQQHEFAERSRMHAHTLRTQMTDELRALGCTVTNSVANFCTFSLPDGYDTDHFFRTMLARGIVLRHTKNYVGLDGQWLRIAVKDNAMWQRCLQEMKQYVDNVSHISSCENSVE